MTHRTVSAACQALTAAGDGQGLMRGRLGVCALAVLALGSARTSDAAGWDMAPSFSATQFVTDNRDLSATNQRAEAITVLSPGIRLSKRGGKLTAALGYALNGQVYARDSSANSFSNVLDATLNAEVVDNHAFLAASAAISQRSISAFGAQGNRPNAINSNATEVRTLSVSPSLRGRLFGDIELQAALTSSLSSSADDEASDRVAHTATLSVGESVGRVGWSLAASSSTSDFDGGRRTTVDQVNGQVFYAPYAALRFFLNAGAENGDVLGADSRASDVWGGGFSWQPTVRTQIALQGQRRYFGDSYSLTLSHRFRRAAITYTDSRSSTDSVSDARFTLSVYDLFFLQFASIEPDPVLREQLVRDFLRASGLDADERVSGGALFRAVSLQQSRALSFALRGARSSAVASAFFTSTRRLDVISTAQDDLSRVGVLRQQGLSLSLSHRLTPSTSVVLSGAYSRTPDAGGVLGNALKTVSMNWSHALGARTAVSVAARHVQATGSSPYTENSLSAQLNYRF